MINVKQLALLNVLICSIASSSLAEPTELGATGQVRVTAGAPSLSVSDVPSVVQGKALEGKKVTVTQLETIPLVPTNNLRSVLSQTPGLLVSEVNNESFASMNYRGIGDPHETFNLLLLKDGLAIGADPFGYPANYYMPPFDTLDRIELVRGGASLLYGPQPGGALNFITRQPKLDGPLSFTTKQRFGSNSLYSTYNEISGGDADHAGLAFFHHRQSDGFRSFNSDSDVYNGGLRSVSRLSSQTTARVDLDLFDGDFGEPGGLSLESGEGIASYLEDRDQSTLRFDRLRIERYVPTFTIEHEVDSQTSVTSKNWAGYYSRYSKRQNVGAGKTFGGFPLDATNSIVRQEFGFVGTDNRVAYEWDTDQVLTAGIVAQHIDSPFTQRKGDAPDSESGALQRQVDRATSALSFVLEQIFKVGDLKVVPGVRLENLWQDLDERFDVANPPSLRSETRYDAVPLGAVGLEYAIADNAALYANMSQGYKPVTYQDVIPLQTGDIVSGDLEEARSLSYEAGLRAKVTPWLSFDSSTFLYRYKDQFGRVGPEIRNVGRARYYGVETAIDLDLFAAVDAATSSDTLGKFGSFSLYGNSTLLNAEFTEGPVDGKTPQYAPDYLLRTGVVYDYQRKAKLALLGQLTGDHFADDGNSANRYIPAYRVWDLTSEIALSKEVSLVAGVTNLFDAEYYSRIRSNGIEPGAPRSYYAGIEVKL